MTSFYRSYSGRGNTHTDAKSVRYRGFLIYHVASKYEFGRAATHDIVRFGVCVGQYAGPRGARWAIDKYLDGGYLWNREVWDAAAI